MTQSGYLPHLNEPYMNTRQQEFFQQRLENWRLRLQQESRHSIQRIRTSEPTGGDLLDRSVKDAHQAMDLLTRERLDRTLRQIDAALQRLQVGSYGYCLETGEEIGIQRLLAWPLATLCVEAQELLERRQCRHPSALAG